MLKKTLYLLPLLLLGCGVPDDSVAILSIPEPTTPPTSISSTTTSTTALPTTSTSTTVLVQTTMAISTTTSTPSTTTTTLALSTVDSAPQAAVETLPTVQDISGPATVSSVAVRVSPPTTEAPEPPEPPSGPPAIIPGDCESVRRVFNYFDPSGNSAAFFVDGGIAKRESGCGLDTLNESTGDTGVVQLNPVHNRAGYFGGRSFGDGGWLMALHGLRTRQDTLNSEWANAAITLRKVCGNGPWATGGNYSCLYRSL